MRITVEPGENSTTLHLRGEFDIFYCPMLEKEIGSLRAAGVNHVILNLRLVSFINSTALGAIFKASKSLKTSGGQMVISRPSPFCREIIKKIGLDRIVPIFDADEEARSFLRGSQPGPTSEDETSILFSPRDASRVEAYIPAEQCHSGTSLDLGPNASSSWWGVGRMSALDENGLRFTWDGGKSGLTPFEMGQMLAFGTDLNVKFRMPLSPEEYCEAVVTVLKTEERAEGIKLSSRFTEIDRRMLDAIKRHAEALAFLKKELQRSATRP